MIGGEIQTKKLFGADQFRKKTPKTAPTLFNTAPAAKPRPGKEPPPRTGGTFITKRMKKTAAKTISLTKKKNGGMQRVI